MNANTVTCYATYFLYTSLTHTHTDAKVQRPCHMPDLVCHCNYIPALRVTPIHLPLSLLISHTFQLFPISSSLSLTICLSLSFAVPPMIWIQNQLVGAALAQNISLECQSEAYPKSINYWMKNDTIIVPGKSCL